jgi:hypothetical protein
MNLSASGLDSSIIRSNFLENYDEADRKAYEKHVANLPDLSVPTRLEQIIRLSFGKLTNTIIDLFGGPKAFQLPELAWKDSYLNNVGHIVNIKPDEMSQPLMWGIDPKGRLFFAAKIRIVHPANLAAQLSIVTFFQIFPERDLWVVGYESPLKYKDSFVMFLNSGAALTYFSGQPNEAFLIFQNLVKGEKVNCGEVALAISE